MQKTRKIFIIIILTVALTGIVVIIDKYFSRAELKNVDLILQGNIKISPWTNEEDGNSYYFLPSYVKLEEIHLLIGEGNEITINDKLYHDGDNLSDLSINQSYVMRDQDNIRHNIRFLQSENISSVFVSTASGSMKNVLASKGNSEVIKVTVLDKDGNINLERTDSKIKGRGNSTWDQQEKKPFVFVFEEPVSVLGMGVSSKWAVLANAFDISEIRNAIVFDTAKEIGLETPDYKYVDLYLNGEYNGLYMICQSVDTFTERTDIDGDNYYLFTAEESRRIEEWGNVIYAGDENLIDVRIPKELHQDEKEKADKIIKNVDTVIARGGNIEDCIDLDSWVKKYLIDEIFENYDSGITSSYFYTRTRTSDSKLYAGPIWDYDNILGNRNAFAGATLNPEILYADQEYRAKDQHVLWYSKLCSNPVFYNALKDTFENVLLPQMEYLIEKGINDRANEISAAKKSNDIRWHIDTVDEYEYLTDFLSKRIGFLKNIWLNAAKYVEVTYYNASNNIYKRIYVTKDNVLSDEPEVMAWFSGSDKWYCEGTDELYDFDFPVDNPVCLVNAPDSEAKKMKNQSETGDLKKKLALIGASLSAMLMALVFRKFVERMRRGVR